MKNCLYLMIVSFMVLTNGCRFNVADQSMEPMDDKQGTQLDGQLQSLITQLERKHAGPFESHVVKDDTGNIVEICLVSDMVSDDNLKTLSALPKVNKLVLCCSANNAMPLTEDSFSLLKRFKQLRCLVLYGAVDELSAKISRSIASIDSLDWLVIEYSKITNDGILVLKKRGLKHLQISESCTILE